MEVDDRDPGTSSEIIERVKEYIDSDTCDRPRSSSRCGDTTTTFYNEFYYKNYRVIVTSQIPDHKAETDQLMRNPNERCESWQFAKLPINPSKGPTADDAGLGPIGLAVTGGVFFNDQAMGDNLAMFAESRTLDSCFGHSNMFGTYHYHSNINCTDAGAATGANDPSVCKHIGHLRDGVPVYGFCNNSTGHTMTSCYKLVNGAVTTTVDHVSGTYANIGQTRADYEFDRDAWKSGACNLDEGSGAIHPTTGQYSYFMTTEYPWTPIKYFGDHGVAQLCSAL